jgi:hypothetical protein
MTQKGCLAAVITLMLFFSSSAAAVTMRYALIIGNNVGVDEQGEEPFPPLLHAKREAERLRRQLIDVANFDESEARTRLLINATRAEVSDAFASLARQRKKDAELIEDMESIFFLYYTGHGLSGRLLLSDGPMSSQTLTRLFNRVGADFSVGVFDACYAGSLDTLLKKKGMRPVRGLSVAKEMPDQVLSAKGSIWFVSSGAGQPSYEDRQLGGVFTHFFIEALDKAGSDGPGITLERIWHYARQKTIDYTMSHNRHQIPEQFVSKLRSQAPVYFSFPNRNSAKLILSENFHGRFALSYADGLLVKVFEKKGGQKKEIVVYPGKVELFHFDGPVGRETATMHVEAGETLVVHPLPESPPRTGIGQNVERLFAKGIGSGELTATAIKPGRTVIWGLGYGVAFASHIMLHPRHQLLLPIRIDSNHWFGSTQLMFSGDRRRYPGLSYRAVSLGVEGSGGQRFCFSQFDLQLGMGLHLSHVWQKYDDSHGYAQKGWTFYPSGQIGIIFPPEGKWLWELSGNLGPLYGPGAAEISTHSWHVAGGIRATIFWKGF